MPDKRKHSGEVVAKKRFGQNFLHDERVLDRIVNESQVDKDTLVVEIGPGLGALTKRLCQKAGFVLAYEIDYTLIEPLKDTLQFYNNYELINKDVLTCDVEADIKKYRGNLSKVYLVANLPYYITTPIILGLLSTTKLITRYVVMVQKEVGMRICSKPKTKDYNALSLAVMYRANAKVLFDVDRHAFTPVPNVTSSVICLDLLKENKYELLSEGLFFKLIKEAFSMRRKTLVNNLSGYYDKELINKMLRDLKYKPAVRAEELGIEDFINMSNYFLKEKDIYKKAYSKVNLALEVMDTEGGYHKVNNLMAPIDLYDEMYFKYDDEIILEDNPYGDDNIIVKAAKAFKEAFGIKSGARIICKKHIPAAAGLAGGSTDGATTLLGLCELYDINKKDKRIYDIAASLGSDVPFFLYNKIALCTNRGEVINTLDFDFKPIKVLLVKPELGLSTAAVYKEYKYDGKSKSDKINNIIDALKNDDVKALKENIFNDLTTPALKLNADLCKIYNDINKTTTVFLSGSGPTLFIVEPNKTIVNKIKKEYKDIFIYEGLIKAKN